MYFSGRIELSAALLGCAVLLCSCGVRSGRGVPTETVTVSGEPSFTVNGAEVSCELKAGDELAVKYSMEAEPLTYYAVKAKESGSCTVRLAGGDDDINCLSVTASPDESGSMERVVRSSSSGQVEFQLRITGEGSSIAGQAEIIPAEKAGYTLLSDSSGRVRILLRDKDISDSGADKEQISEWLGALDSIRETASAWSADGLESVDICAACTFQHYGLSGDPIYINRDYMSGELRKAAETAELPKKQQDILHGFAHEICHAADGFGHGGVSPAVFDTELSAQLGSALCMEVNGYRYNGSLTALEYFSEKDTLGKRMYTDEAFIYRLLEIFDEKGTYLKDILPVFTMRREHSGVKTASEGLEAFLDDLSLCAGYDVESCFTETELDTVRIKFAMDDRKAKET